MKRKIKKSTDGSISSIEWENNSTTKMNIKIKVAIIGVIGAVLAALIGGVLTDPGIDQQNTGDQGTQIGNVEGNVFLNLNQHSKQISQREAVKVDDGIYTITNKMIPASKKNVLYPISIGGKLAPGIDVADGHYSKATFWRIELDTRTDSFRIIHNELNSYLAVKSLEAGELIFETKPTVRGEWGFSKCSECGPNNYIIFNARFRDKTKNW